MSTFFSASFFVQHLTALLGTLGFAVLFKVRARHLPLAGACGLFTWLVYYTVTFFGGTLFLAAFLASAVATVFAECCARVRRAPAPVFLVPGTIPIVPGSDLYYTMRYLLLGNFDVFANYLMRALLVGIGIGGGIVAVSVAVSLLPKRKNKLK